MALTNSAHANKRQMIIDTKYYSQYLDVQDPYWQPRSCSIVCLKMLMDYYRVGDKKNKLPEIGDLIKEGFLIGGFGMDGWMHDAIVMLAHNCGFSAYRQEFRSMDIDYESKKTQNGIYHDKLSQDGIEKIVRYLHSNKPVIVSAVKKFQEEDKFHTVVLIGYEEKDGKIVGFYYHDPDALVREDGEKQFVNMETFEKFWRRLAIFITP
jgi:hypothetical protein